MNAAEFEEVARRINAIGMSGEDAMRKMRLFPPLTKDENAMLEKRLSPRLPLWERVVCYLLDSLTQALDWFTKRIQR